MKHQYILDGSQEPAAPIGPDDYRFGQARLVAYCLDSGKEGGAAWERHDHTYGIPFYERTKSRLDAQCGCEHELVGGV